MSNRTGNQRRYNWMGNLTPEQVATVRRLREDNSGGTLHAGTAGWSVYMAPTTLPVRYLELRHWMTGGHVARWVIERDGTVSAHNALGDHRDLRPVT